MSDDVGTIIRGVGPTLRALRTRRRITLTDAAKALGVGISTMSRLESGERSPTLDLLIPLARLYGVALDEIVVAPPTGDPRIRPRPVKRHGMVYVPLTSSSSPIQAFKIILPGHTRNASTERSHDGYEWFYVLSGAVDLQLGDTHTTINTGEAAEFNTGHRTSSPVHPPHRPLRPRTPHTPPRACSSGQGRGDTSPPRTIRSQ